MKTATHTGVVENANYGSPRKETVELRETKMYWVAVPSGNKYRKSSGRPAGADMWNQIVLRLNTIKPKDGA